MLTEKRKNREANIVYMKRKIILASSSPRRKKILRLAHIDFKAVNSNLNESYLTKKFKILSPKKLVKVLSIAKALSALNSISVKDQIIVGFDTIISFQNTIIGKPRNKKEALKILTKLSGKKHKVITGFCILDLKYKKIITDSEITIVHMKNYSISEALKYVKTGEPMDKAGAYAIQGIGKTLVKKIEGDYLNVIGLPLQKFVFTLKKLNIARPESNGGHLNL